MKKIILLTVSVLALAGCQGLTSSKKPVSIYNLRYTGAETAAMETAGVPGVMVISEPMLPAGLETDRIALYLDQGRRLDYYADASWAESLEDVLQDVIVQAGRAALPQMVVDSPRLNVPANYRLAVNVLDFTPVYSAAPESAPDLKVAVNFTLVHLPEKLIISDFTLENGRAATANNLPAVAAGLEELMNSILTAGFEKVAEATQAFEAENARR